MRRRLGEDKMKMMLKRRKKMMINTKVQYSMTVFMSTWRGHSLLVVVVAKTRRPSCHFGRTLTLAHSLTDTQHNNIEASTPAGLERN